MSNKKKLSVLKRFWNDFTKFKFSTYSASSAFYLFLSIVPIIILICSIIPYTSVSQDDIVGFINNLIPESTESLFDGIIADIFAGSITTFSFSAITLIWSAGKAINELTNGLNHINGVQDYKNVILQRIRASFFTVILIIVVILSLVGMVFGKYIV